MEEEFSAIGLLAHLEQIWGGVRGASGVGTFRGAHHRILMIMYLY